MVLVDKLRPRPVDAQAAQIKTFERRMKIALTKEEDLVRREALEAGIERMEVASGARKNGNRRIF